MKLLKKIILVLLFLLPISNSFGAMHSFVQKAAVTDGTNNDPSGVHFNPDGTKMFILSQLPDNAGADVFSHVSEYNLSTPFDVSTKTYAGDGERCILNNGEGDYPSGFGPVNHMYDLEFSHNGMMLFVGRGNTGHNHANADRVFRFDLTSPYDISTCNFPVGSAVHATLNLDSQDLQNGSNANAVDVPVAKSKNRLRGFDFSNDGKKLFIVMGGAGGNHYTRLLEYQLSIAYDLSTISLVTDAGIRLQDSGSDDTPVGNAKGFDFSPNGKRLWVIDHGDRDITQISLDVAFSTSSYTIDGTVALPLTGDGNAALQPSGLTFSTSGLKMYTTNDEDEDVLEYNLVCPFNIIAGRCPSITENSDRTGMAEAQIELAKRTINFSTNSALNRLKWIRRNKDKQNLSNQNVKLNFSNSMLSSLEAIPISSFKKVSTSKNNNDSNKKYFYWSEGSVSLGRVGDTSIASTKKFHTNSLTFGLDRFTDDHSINGFAFRFGKDDVDIGSAGSNLDSNTYNITYYSTSPIKDDTKYLDKIFGIGKIRSDILTVLDSENLTADRTGSQIYGAFKIKDEYKKNKLTLIPSGQFDFGHTILHRYKEAGRGAIEAGYQHVTTKNLRAAMAFVEDLSNDKYTLKRHGKFEYVAELDRSSNFKYTYVSDESTSFNDTFYTGALHNLNGEIGIDIIFPEHFSVFIIYERNHAFGTGYTDNLYIAFGYIPHQDTEYAFSLNGSENLLSKFEIKKNINGYDLSFNLNDDLTNLGNNKEASINLNKVF